MENPADKIMSDLIKAMPKIVEESARAVELYCNRCLFQKECRENGIPENKCPAIKAGF